MHILSGCRKKMGFNYEQRLEMGPRPIIGIVDHLIAIFAAKLIALFSIYYVRMPSISKTYHCADRSTLALLNAYEERLRAFKLMTSQVLQKARLIRASINVLASERVKFPTINHEDYL